ncbi:MAG: 3-methyl-2-oxobutanoate hydroxymethyltransferase [Gaiellales bacterium]
MSTVPHTDPRVSLNDLRALKQRRQPIVMVTAYDYPGGHLCAEAGVDVLLVGDSAAMTVLGHDSTVPISLEEMAMLAAAVRRGAPQSLIVGDLPFGSYEESDQHAVRSAVTLRKSGGVDVVKLEGGSTMVERARSIVRAGIAVCGHIGLTPQSSVLIGGYKAQGRTAERAIQLVEDALALEHAGASLLVLEGIPSPVAARITDELAIPTIGIGAGPGCDGQVLVYHDLLGLTEGRRPRFVRQYADLAGTTRDGLSAFAADVRSGRYPAVEHEYTIPQEELVLFDEDRRSTRSRARL